MKHIFLIILVSVVITSCGGSYQDNAMTECEKNDPLCFEMLLIPGGNFMMGSEEGYEDWENPVHPVAVNTFQLMETEVTRRMYKPCVDDGVCADAIEDLSLGDYPISNINWEDAHTYIRWLNEKLEANYRLPTEEEWEYAARAGTTTDYYWGDSLGDDCSHVIWVGCNPDFINQAPSPVKSHSPNSFGLYDITGNVQEIVSGCRQRYTDKLAGVPLPSDEDCEAVIYRGGSWADGRNLTNYARSGSTEIQNRNNTVGFRLAQDL